MMLNDPALTPFKTLLELGIRFKEIRLRLNKTQKEISRETAVSIPTIYKFENGKLTDITISVLFKLLRSIGMSKNFLDLIPELPESPYMYKSDRKKQRARK